MPNDASPDSSLAAPWIIIKNFARHCEEHLHRVIRCNLPQLNQIEFYHPNVDQVSMSPNSSFFRSCSLGGAQCGLHHGVLRECWLLCAQHEVAQDGAPAPWIEVCDPYQVPRTEGLGLGASKRCRMSHRSFSCFHILENFQIWNLCMHGLSHRSVFLLSHFR